MTIAKTLRVGTVVQIISMARTDAIGRVIRLDNGYAIVRLERWQADGYHLDVSCRPYELRKTPKRSVR